MPRIADPRAFFASVSIFILLIKGGAAASGCCSQKYKTCDVNWCGNTKESCESCGNGSFYWLENGAYPSGTHCLERWLGCKHYPNSCCPGAICRPNANNWMQCLHNLDSPQISNPPPPTPDPSPQPSPEPTPGPSEGPTPVPTPEPTQGSTPEPTPEPSPLPTPAPTTQGPTPGPTTAPVTGHTPGPVTAAPVTAAPVTAAPVSVTTPAPVTPSANACCSQNYLDCNINWCGSTEEDCKVCGDKSQLWLKSGPLADGTCAQRWAGCAGNESGCCAPATCRDNGGGMGLR